MQKEELLVVAGLILFIGFIAQSTTNSITGEFASAFYTCSDSDNGRSIYKAGQVSEKIVTPLSVPSVPNRFNDKCLDKTRLKEYYCKRVGLTDTRAKNIIVKCEYGCFKNACQKQSIK
ncbi:MAG: hypothetical protein Q7R96_06355 [Nanoarchaeota archaeon]|nr:hypothetical protein [Nanoarchaeota archaeon]